MHSSRMRTGRSLTVSAKIWRPPAKKLETPQKIGEPPENLEPPHPYPENLEEPKTPDTTPPPPWTEFLTHASENITLAQLRCGR